MAGELFLPAIVFNRSNAMNALKAIAHGIDFINTWVARIMAVITIPLLFITFFGVIMRYVFHSPLVWVGQVLLLLYVPMLTLAGGYLLKTDQHIRIDLIYDRFSRRGKAIADVATFIVFFLFILAFSYVTIQMAWNSTMMLEKSWSIFKGPVYPKKIAIALAAVLLLLQGIVQLFRNIGIIKNKEQ